MVEEEKSNGRKAEESRTERDSTASLFGDVVFSYTRAQAIEDGVLVDVTERARECGIRFPVALTLGVWSACVTVPPEAEGQDEAGRLWDILNLLRFAIVSNQQQMANRVDFTVRIQNGPGRNEDVRLYALCGPGDNGEPVITVMLPHED